MMAFPCRLFNRSVQKMFPSLSKLLPIPIASQRAFRSTPNRRVFGIYSGSEVMDANFGIFKVCDSHRIGEQDNWVDFKDSSEVEFRAVRYGHPPPGFVTVFSDGCTEEEPINPELETGDRVGDSTAAAVKRSDKGALLNSCAVKLGVVDVLTAEAEGARMGLLMSDDDEMVRLCLESQELAVLLNSRLGVPPKSCEDLIFEMRSMINTKRRNGAILEIQVTDRITNYLADRMAQLPKMPWWAHPIGSPRFFDHEEDLPTRELQKILGEDMAGYYRFAKKTKKRKSVHYH